MITVLEVLSPTNKKLGEGWLKYKQKQRDLFASGVNLVEVDLVRSGIRPFPFSEDDLPDRCWTTYLAWARRVWQSDRVEVYPIPPASRLPVLRIPLRETDTDVPLDLQTLLDQAYLHGAYEGDLAYSKDPDAPLQEPDRTWANHHLRKLGLRKPSRRNGKAK